MKYKIFVVQQIGNTYRKIDEVKYKSEESLARYKKHKIPIPPIKVDTLSTDKLSVLFFDIDSKEYVTFKKYDLGLSTEFLEELFGNNIIGQLVRAVKRATQKEQTGIETLKQILIIGGAGIVGYFLGASYGVGA